MVDLNTQINNTVTFYTVTEVTSKNRIVKEKSCDAQIEVVNSQIVLYEIEHGELPTSMSQVILI